MYEVSTCRELNYDSSHCMSGARRVGRKNIMSGTQCAVIIIRLNVGKRPSLFFSFLPTINLAPFSILIPPLHSYCLCLQRMSGVVLHPRVTRGINTTLHHARHPLYTTLFTMTTKAAFCQLPTIYCFHCQPCSCNTLRLQISSVC